MIGLCTDSNSQIPPDAVARFGVAVVPMSVTVGDRDYLEGEDLDADRFYDLLSADPRPPVSTGAPAPGRFAQAYDRLAAAGATEIVSIHLGSALSGTCNAARLGMASSPVPVRLVDTGAGSFAIAFAVLAAGEAIDAGATAEEAAAAALETARDCGNAFVVGTLDLARAGGRLAVTDDDHDVLGLTVLALVGGAMRQVASALSADAAAAVLSDFVGAGGERLRVGVGHSDASSVEVADELASLLRDRPSVVDVVRYRVGPSVGAHTGPGTAGAVFHPMP